MERKKLFYAFQLTVVLLMIALVPSCQRASARQGPRTEDMVMFYYADVASAYAALAADEIDIVAPGLAYSDALPHQGLLDSGLLTAWEFFGAITNPNIVLGEVAAFNMYQLDLNNNHTIHQYPGVVNMMWYAPVRRAAAWCTDKDFVVETICGGFAERIDAPIAAPSKAWANESYWYPNYPYEYDPAAASAHLDANGWVQGTTPNPNYDAGFPGSAQFLRVYGNGHPDQGTDMHAMRWFIRIDDPRRLQPGRLVADVMEKIGFQVERYEANLQALMPSVMIEKNYHVYTGCWTVDCFPLYLHTLYNSRYWMDGVNSPNYVTGHDASGMPNHPKYDGWAESLFYAQTLGDAVHASKQATGYWTEQCISVPLWSDVSFCAWQTKVLGLVNMKGYGVINPYSFLNAYKQDGTPIRVGSISPTSMNPFYASTVYDYTSLDRIYSYVGPDSPPYDTGLDQAGWLRDYEVGLWCDPDTIEDNVTEPFYSPTPGAVTLEKKAFNIDDVKADLTDSFTVGETVFPVAVQEILRPDGDGTFQQWTPVSVPPTLNHWECVDEEVANGDDDRVETALNDQWDSYTLQSPIEVGSIANVTVHVEAKNNFPTLDDSITIFVVANGVAHQGSTHILSGDYAHYGHTWQMNPETLAAWNSSDIESLEAGVISVRGGAAVDCRVTQLYVEVFYEVYPLSLRRTAYSIYDVTVDEVSLDPSDYVFTPPSNELNITIGLAEGAIIDVDYFGLLVPGVDYSFFGGWCSPSHTITFTIDLADGALISVQYDAVQTKTYMRQWVRSDSYFCEPATGTQLSNVNSSTYLFSLWYTHADPTAWGYTGIQDVHHVEVHDDYSWTTYFDTESCWFHRVAAPMLYLPDWWLRSPLATATVENFLGFTGPGTVPLAGIPVWINEVTMDGTPLTFGVDYNLFGRGPGTPITLKILTAQGPGALAVDYYAYGDPAGFTPGDLPWQDTLAGSGMYYMTSFTPGVGGWAAYKRNPYYYLETPPLGEADFIWNYVGTTKPRSGYYDVDIYDVVLAAGAYGASATGIPSPRYVAGADLAPVGGLINIYDIVTLTGQYGVRWGEYP